MKNKENTTKETNTIQKVEKQNKKQTLPKYMEMNQFHAFLLTMITNADENINEFLEYFENRKEIDLIAEAITILYNIPEEGDKEQYNFLYNAVSKLMYKILMKMWHKNGDVEKEDFECLEVDYFKKQAFLEVSTPDSIEIFIDNLLGENIDMNVKVCAGTLLRTVFLYITNTDIIPKSERTLDKALELLSMMYTSGYDDREESEFDKLVSSFGEGERKIEDRAFLNSYMFSKKIQIDEKQRALQICASELMKYINMNGLNESDDCFIMSRDVLYLVLELEKTYTKL